MKNLRRIILGPAIVVLSALAVSGAAPAASRTVTIKLLPPSGAGAIQITVDGGRIQVKSGGTILLTGDTKDGQKRRYVGSGKAVVAEVKMGEPDGFKVRTPAGKLLWKVKTADAKTKVSDNEENKGAYEMAKKGNTVRVSKDERLLGTFAFGPELEAGAANATPVKDPNGKVVAVVEPAGSSLAGGVALMAAIPPELRHIIMAELLARAN